MKVFNYGDLLSFLVGVTNSNRPNGRVVDPTANKEGLRYETINPL
jgi:hypothetical protein